MKKLSEFNEIIFDENIFGTPQSCRLCPRNCGADRTKGPSGSCKSAFLPRVVRAAAHFWEEPCISGSSGSGTVFFSGCALGCVFCQNAKISRAPLGKEYSPSGLAEIFLSLQHEGVENINLVTPSHFAPAIASALSEAKKNGLFLPVVWNSSGYERPETIRLLE
ncbi:MAG: 4Fe-4S cluster-binding domain-containing protein, partial [Firmicutes bacterium]|nr:4Fe-4S cluster-binding domain-containing protein [Bacillota bacterium]